MKALLIVAHGSRRSASNDEVRRLTARLRSRAVQFEIVDCAFLELAEPSIPDGLRRLIDSGATEVAVVPYFLSAGRHVTEDVPAEIAKVAAERPEAAIRQMPYLGRAEGIADLVLDQALGTYRTGDSDPSPARIGKPMDARVNLADKEAAHAILDDDRDGSP